MLNVYAEEVIVLIVLAFLILGPRRMQHYARQLGELVRSVRDMAEGARGQIKDELGPAFDDIDWRQLDPRQYDPRRIVREALATPSATASSATQPASVEEVAAVDPTWAGKVHDPRRPTPFDEDAT